jgi:DNA polymerase-3 subunit alpha
MQHYNNASCPEVDERSMNDKWLDKEFRIGGIITEAKTGISARNGDPYGIMTIEDYNGPCSIRLYKSEFLKYKSFFEKDSFVYIKGTLKQYSHPNPDGTIYTSKPKMKIIEMMLLSDLIEKKTRLVRFTVNLDSISMQFCRELQELAKKNKGKTPLEALVIDKKNNLSLTMKSRDLMVNPRKMMNALGAMKEVDDIKPILAQY